MKKLLFPQKFNAEMIAESMDPKGVHHTVSYATSYEETWNHIRSEVRGIYSNSPNLAPERKVLA